MADGVGLELGLLYQKDADSTDFPLTEIKRAVRCFVRRKDCSGLTPDAVFLNPAQAALIEPEQTDQVGLTVKTSDRIPVNYIWLTGR